MPRKKSQPTERPYTTDYGMSKGHCTSKKSCLIAAFKKVVNDELSHVTLEGPNGKAMARIRRYSFWGIHIEVPGQKPQYVPGTGHEPHLRVVKKEKQS